jgi:hypothetical protein
MVRQEGYAGVIQSASGKRWRAWFVVKGKRIHVGYFDSPLEAHLARETKRKEMGVNTFVEDLEGEEWRVCPIIEGNYRVSNKGRAKSINFNGSGDEQLLKLRKHTTGLYWVLPIQKNSPLLHRLIAIAFIPNPNNYPEVNHLDRDGFNNDITNLEWVLPRENSTHWRKLNATHLTGCTFTNGRWMAHIKVNGKNITLGYYDTEQEAHERYLLALKEYGLVNKYAYL